MGEGHGPGRCLPGRAFWAPDAETVSELSLLVCLLGRGAHHLPDRLA